MKNNYNLQHKQTKIRESGPVSGSCQFPELPTGKNAAGSPLGGFILCLVTCSLCWWSWLGRSIITNCNIKKNVFPTKYYFILNSYRRSLCGESAYTILKSSVIEFTHTCGTWARLKWYCIYSLGQVDINTSIILLIIALRIIFLHFTCEIQKRYMWKIFWLNTLN